MHQHTMYPGDVAEELFDGEYHVNVSMPNDRAVTVYFSE